MPNTQTISSHIPYLRRYARALTGSQKAGDAYVTEVVAALLADSSTLDSSLSPRVGLYKALTKVWKSVPINGRGDSGPARDHSVDSKLETMTPMARQAFLLMTIEDFSAKDAAAVIDVNESEIDGLLSQAGREIAEQIASDVLIIEDEPIIAMDIEHIVHTLGHNVVGIARTHNEAVGIAKKKRPGLVLADIQLADGSSGINAVNEILEGFELPVIFITAYPERLLTGERPEPTFLITKPFQPETIKAVISQALFFDQTAHVANPKKAAAG
jgi:DNA-directed RNA polymerase specialized sigma24 family protein/CheY-like chemotaxis protein